MRWKTKGRFRLVFDAGELIGADGAKQIARKPLAKVSFGEEIRNAKKKAEIGVLVVMSWKGYKTSKQILKQSHSIISIRFSI